MKKIMVFILAIVLLFNVVYADVAMPTTSSINKTSNTILYICGAVVLALTVAIVIIWINRKKK